MLAGQGDGKIILERELVHFDARMRYEGERKSAGQGRGPNIPQPQQRYGEDRFGALTQPCVFAAVRTRNQERELP